MPYLPWLRQIVCDVTIVTQQCKPPQTIAKLGWKSWIQITETVEAMGLTSGVQGLNSQPTFLSRI